MNEDIAKIDDISRFGNPIAKCRITSERIAQRLANDRELSFDGGAQHLIGFVVSRRPIAGELENRRGSHKNIFEECRQLTRRHRSHAVYLPESRGSSDFS